MSNEIRDTLFGDMPIDAFPASSGKMPEHEPWASFVRARESLTAGRKDEAIALWLAISKMPAMESRIYAQAWHFLRSHGVQPPPEIHKQLLGVVIEMPVNGGLDLLAAYPERSARYYNYSGAGIIWEHPDKSLDQPIDALLAAGERVLRVIGPWDKPRRPVPPPGRVRINFISPAGLHFGEGDIAEFMKDPMAGPVIQAGAALMSRLVALHDTKNRK